MYQIVPQIRLHAVITSGVYLSSSLSTEWKTARMSLKKREACAFFHSKLDKAWMGKKIKKLPKQTFRFSLYLK